MKLKELLIESRQKLNITQEEMAKLLKVSPPVYRFLEYGDPLWDTEPLMKEVRKIVKERLDTT
jgi:DNA-binding XRE family transcriptional regulator